jgi:hypothetical protein
MTQLSFSDWIFPGWADLEAHRGYHGRPRTPKPETRRQNNYQWFVTRQLDLFSIERQRLYERRRALFDQVEQLVERIEAIRPMRKHAINWPVTRRTRAMKGWIIEYHVLRSVKRKARRAYRRADNNYLSFRA